MDLTEAGLELLVKQLKELIEPRVASLTYDEISTISTKIPTFQTMLDFREIRDQFLGKFNNPCDIPESHLYTEQLLDHSTDDCDLPEDTKKSLNSFFIEEIDRVKRLRETVLTRCLQPEFFSKVQMHYAEYEDSITRHLYACHEGLLRIQTKEYSIYTTNDLLIELTSTFVQKRRTAVYRSFLLHIRRFPLTSQQKIYSNMFLLTQKSIKEDQLNPIVPTLPQCVKGIDEDLKRLSQRLNMIPELDKSDGQYFLYQSNKKFAELFEKLSFFELPRKKYDFPLYFASPDLTELTQKLLLESTIEDAKLRELFDHIFSFSIDEVAQRINHHVSTYNQMVGNEARSRTFRDGRVRTIIPSHKIASWLQLRFVHIKYLATAVLSHLNYLEYIRCQLLSKKNNIMRSTEYNCRHSKEFKEILEIYDNNGAFIFESAIESFQELVKNFVNIGSYYIRKFEDGSPERTGEQTLVVDRVSIIESLFQHELNFLNAKRRLIQPLIDALEHQKNSKLVDLIHEVVATRPKFNLPIYNSFNAPYKLAISLMEKKAEIIRSLINIQILHERSLATTMGVSVPLFDRPSNINTEISYRSFDESFPISPFEVYESLTEVYKFIEVVPKVAQELGETADLKLIKYGDYLQLSIWMEIEDLLRHVFEFGIFPFDRASSNFSFKLSSSVNSLFVSPFVNTFETIKDIIFKMKENRRLRFLLSTRRFMHLTWKLQTLMYDTDLLQKSYYQQCDQLSIPDKGIVLSSFKECATKEIIDLPHESFDIDLLDFALTEFEEITLNFSSESSIKDIIFAADFSMLKRMIRFQNLQNTILEIAVRYSRHILDSNFFVSYFELGPSYAATFVTGVEIPSDEEDYNSVFFKQLVAYRIFYQSTAIFRDNQLAQECSSQFSLSIKDIKSKSRTILSAHVKQKELSDQEMFEMYLNEIIDAFSAYAYRIEIAHLCNLERQILLTNSFIDTFVLGPDPTVCLVNSSGHFEKFFYVPTWVESFTMICNAPHARQGMVLKSVLHFIESRFRILNLVRHECSLSQRITVVFESIYNQNFQCETPVFQKLFTEFAQLENAIEVEISTKYILEKEKFLFYRFEYSILSALEQFFLSINKANDKSKIADPHFSEIIQHLWIEMHEPLDNDKWLITTLRYVPLWQQHFMYRCLETDRAEFVTRIGSTDNFLESSVLSLYRKQFNNNEIQILPLAIDFLSLTICQLHIKFAYFLLLEGYPEDRIDIRSTILKMNSIIYFRNAPKWDSIILQQANEHLVPKDESPSRVTDTIPEPKLAQSIFDVVRNQVDLMMLSEQIKQIQGKIEQFTTDNQNIRTIVSSTSKVAFNHGLKRNASKLCVTNPEKVDFQQLHTMTSTGYATQFQTESSYAHKRLVEILGNKIVAAIVNKKDDEILFDNTSLEEACAMLSTLINEFISESLSKMNETWKKYIANISVSLDYNNEEMDAAQTLAKLTDLRFARHTESEVGNKFQKKFLGLNKYNQQIYSDEQTKIRIESQMERRIRDYYETLLDDLRTTINNVNDQKESIKKNVYDRVMNKITRAKNVALRVRKPDEIETEVINECGTLLDDNFVNRIKNKNDQMRKEILMLRVFKCLSETGMKRFYSHKLTEVAQDRKERNEQLWHDKLAFEYHEKITEEKLYQTHQRLSDSKLEIEKLKKQLENAKMSNIQLVHWKAKNLKTIDGIKKQLLDFKGVGDVNIDKLMTWIEDGQNELDELRDFSEKLEETREATVNVSIRKVEKIRTAVRQTKFAQAKMLETANEAMFIEEQSQREEMVQKLSDENIELRHKNETLLEKIRDLENQKAAKSERARILMEETLHSRKPSLRAKTRMATKRTIVKPGLSSRTPTRSASRI
ncbi:hypothetical protein TRFO_20703 [Tritrichomonas foetus]|uniref:Uncharacterized protein n=1 Tax=Tritrichomonas foetus TaxID=1144522 RepID=A0A1J4KG09_9EUKA|nr:hypothetical protein TRFO_20703 [Tritrichomonas foetus]|eukprot:OHT10147.1 hypothetical protein TRFO_20703 [Tritrichomonas foetus]